MRTESAPGKHEDATIHLMDEKNVGALPVVDDKTLVGVVSERDYTRKVIVKGRSSKDTPVSNIMTKKLLTVIRNNTAYDCFVRPKGSQRYRRRSWLTRVGGDGSVAISLRQCTRRWSATIKRFFCA